MLTQLRENPPQGLLSELGYFEGKKKRKTLAHFSLDGFSSLDGKLRTLLLKMPLSSGLSQNTIV